MSVIVDDDAKQTGDSLGFERAVKQEDARKRGRNATELEGCNNLVKEQDVNRDVLGCEYMKNSEDARWLIYEVESLHPSVDHPCNHHQNDVIARLRAYKLRAKGTKGNRCRKPRVVLTEVDLPVLS